MDSTFLIITLISMIPIGAAIVSFIIGAFGTAKNFIFTGIVLLCVQAVILFFNVPIGMADKIRSIPDCKKKKSILKDNEVQFYEYFSLVFDPEDCILYPKEN